MSTPGSDSNSSSSAATPSDVPLLGTQPNKAESNIGPRSARARRSLSRYLRNLRRAWNFRFRIRIEAVPPEEAETYPEDCQDAKHVPDWSELPWFPRLALIIGTIFSCMKSTASDEHPGYNSEPPYQLPHTNEAFEEPLTPEEIYEGFDNKLMLSRLEETQVFSAALRQLAREEVRDGRKICFPSSEVCDLMTLRSVNLPTDPAGLRALLELGFARRNLVLDLGRIRNDFVMAHGIVVIETAKPWPDCYRIVHIPCSL